MLLHFFWTKAAPKLWPDFLTSSILFNLWISQCHISIINLQIRQTTSTLFQRNIRKTAITAKTTKFFFLHEQSVLVLRCTNICVAAKHTWKLAITTFASISIVAEMVSTFNTYFNTNINFNPTNSHTHCRYIIHIENLTQANYRQNCTFVENLINIWRTAWVCFAE